MKLGSISPMNFKGIYEVAGQKTDLNPKNVPAGDWEKGNEDLTYVNLTYRPFIDEVVDEKKIKAAIPGILVQHYYEAGDKYCASAVVPKIEVGKTMNCTQDEWERAHEKEATSTIPNLKEYAHCVHDVESQVRELTPAEEQAIVEAN